jgi:starch phosphorylase
MAGREIALRGRPGEEDRADAEALYNVLEKEIVPLYYDRDRAGVPHGWIRIAKEAIKTVSPNFNARRMMKEYAERMYLTAGTSVVKP